jgi:hypothetical protein
MRILNDFEDLHHVVVFVPIFEEKCSLRRLRRIVLEEPLVNCWLMKGSL